MTIHPQAPSVESPNKLRFFNEEIEKGRNFSRVGLHHFQYLLGSKFCFHRGSSEWQWATTIKLHKILEAQTRMLVAEWEPLREGQTQGWSSMAPPFKEEAAATASESEFMGFGFAGVTPLVPHWKRGGSTRRSWDAHSH